jgi:signal transduction histidine kinase
LSEAELDHGLAKRVQEMQIRQHFDYTRRTLIVSFLASLVIVRAFVNAIEPVWLIYAWAVALNIFSIIRLMLDKLWQQDSTRLENGSRWANLIATFAGLSGLTWGSLGSVLYSSISLEMHPIAIMAVLSVGAGGIMSLVSLRRAYNAFFICMLLPCAIVQALQSSAPEHWASFIIVLFTANLMAGGVTTIKNLRQAFILRMQLSNAVEEAETARRRAELANRTKSMFLANISHELRTPMHAILGFSQLGSTRAEHQKLRDYFSRITTSGGRLLSLIDNLLDISKFEAGRMEIDVQKQAMRPLLDSAVLEITPLLAEKKIQLNISEAPKLPPVALDTLKFAQVIHNLLSNAIKFSPIGGKILILLDSVTTPPQHCHIRMRMQDDGVGIPEDELEGIFDEFVQSSKSHTGAGGTGLGLAICRHIVTAHGGTIFANNRPEGGAELTLELPTWASDATPVTPEP